MRIKMSQSSVGTQHIGVDKHVAEEVIINGDYKIYVTHTKSLNSFSHDGVELSAKNVLNVEVNVYKVNKYNFYDLIENRHTFCRYSSIDSRWVWSMFGQNYALDRHTHKTCTDMIHAHSLVTSIVKKYQ